MKKLLLKKRTTLILASSLVILGTLFLVPQATQAELEHIMPISAVVTKAEVNTKTYPEGSLVRYQGEERIYRIEDADMVPIRTLEELAKYTGQEILNITPDGDICLPEPEVLGVKKYADGTLLRYRGEDLVYIMAFGQMTPIRHLEQLKKYAGQEIISISRFGDQGEVLGVKKYGEGALLRDSNMDIYLVAGSKLEPIRSLEELYKYVGQEIIEVGDSIITNWE